MRSQLRQLKANALVIVVFGVVMFAATSGGATASKFITGKQIKDHSITGADIKLGTIGESNLKKGISAHGGADAGSSKGDTGPAGTPGTSGADGKNGNRIWIVSNIPSFSIQASGNADFLNVPGAKAEFNTTTSHTPIHVSVDAICGAAHGEHIFGRILVDGVPASPGAEEVCYGAPGGVNLLFTLDRDADLSPGAHTVQFQLQTAPGGMAVFGSIHMSVAEVPS